MKDIIKLCKLVLLCVCLIVGLFFFAILHGCSKVDDSYSRFEIEYQESLPVANMLESPKRIIIITDKETGKTFLLVRDCGHYVGITQVRS